MTLADTTLSHTESRLVAVTTAYHQAEEQFGQACADLVRFQKRNFDTRFSFQPDGITTRVNAMTNPENRERMRLEEARERARVRFMDLLAERAELLRELGKIR